MKKIRHHTNPKSKTKSRDQNGRRGAAPSLNLPAPRPDVAGADIGAREIALCVPAGRDPQPVRTFATFTADLQAAVAWLRQCGVRSVAMESTGLYWLAFAQLLAAAHIEVVLVNARHVRHVPGRKSDLLDCQWLQYLHSVGLLRGSFRPSDALCAVRSLTRHRESLLAQAADQVRHAHKAMIQMNLQLQHVIDDLTGATGTAIVEAILAGERDPQILARLRDPRIKASRETLAKSLQGDWRDEHLLVLRLAWEGWRHCRRQLAELDAQIQTRVQQLEGCVSAAPHPMPAASPKKIRPSANQPAGAETLRAEYQRILGSDLTQVPGVNLLTVQSFLSEVGPDLSAFPNAAAFCSWLGLCPGTKISGGRALDTRTRRGKPRLARHLRQAALGLHRAHNALGERYRRLRARLGAPKALTALAHLLARILYKLVTTATAYDQSAFAQLEAEHAARRLKRLQAQAKAFGFTLAPCAS
jgi:transposase